MKRAIAFIGLMSMAPSVFAQSYSGQVSDLNTIFNPPSNIQGIICQAQTNDGNEHSYKACSDGVASARYMAEKHAQKAGQYLGCLDGYYQGVWDGYAAGKNPTADMLAEAQAYVAQSRMETADIRATQKAHAEATTESADQIISRYRKVIGVRDANGNQVMPDKSYQVPPVTFKGFNDGYEHDIQAGRVGGINFRDAQEAGWVNANSSFDDKIAAQKAYLLQGQHAANLCDVNQTMFGRRSMPTLTLWDYFKARREYNFQNYGWDNAGWAWDFFVNDERNLDHFQNYEGIANLEKTITVKVPITERQEQIKRDENGNPIPKRDANGNPIMNNGVPVYETEMVDVVVGYRDETKRVKLDANEVKALKAIYKKGFEESYGRYFAKQYASLKYHEEGLKRYSEAKIIGQMIGEEVARNVAKREAYNSQYKAISASKFAELAKDLYIESFNRLIGIFENNPVMELNSAYVFGNKDDGIFTPGEKLGMYYAVTNLGEVSRPVALSFRSTSDVIATGSETLNPPALDSLSGQTGVMAQVSSSLFTGDTVRINFDLNNPSDIDEVAQELVVSKGQNILLNNYAEIKKIDTYLDPVVGDLGIQVRLQNPSTITTPAFPTVEIVIDGTNEVITKNMDKIEARATAVAGINMNNIDPISLITTNKVSGTVNVKLGGEVIDTQKFSVGVSADKDLLIANYFQGLISGTNTNTGNESLQKRIGTVMTMMEQSLDHDLANYKIKWKRQSDVDSTIVGKLQKVYAAGQNANEIDASVQQQYDKIAKTLARRTNNRGRTRIRGWGDKKFLKALKVFSPSLSTRKRDHRI